MANETIHLTVKQDYDRDAQSLVRRSDDWPFLQHGIPAVFLTTGLHPDYHTPSDDTARIDFAKLERITELASRLVWLAANGDAPRFHAQ
jgi:Zn-dependent M28 family amino/carboxypeptidase